MSATNPTTPTDHDTNDGRDGRGRFAACNTFAGGNPFARKVSSCRTPKAKGTIPGGFVEPPRRPRLQCP
jgi:hypothetical protein